MDGEAPTGYSKNGGAVEKLGELLGVQRGAGDEQLEVRPEAGNVLDKAEQNVRVQCPLVGLKQKKKNHIRNKILIKNISLVDP
jgi:hypothetical protein